MPRTGRTNYLYRMDIGRPQTSTGHATALILGFYLVCAQASHAACGLSFCPRPEEPGANNIDLAFMAKETGFDIQGTDGRYTELMGSVQYTAFSHLALGLHVPFIILEATETEFGLGNLIAYAEWRSRPSWLSAFGAGVQFELPTGESQHGLADDHYMAVPYASLGLPAGPVMLGGALGLATTLYGNHEEGAHHAGHEPTPVFVHPHEHLEFLYRISVGARLLGGKFLPEAFVDGQRVLATPDDPDAGVDFLNLGVSLPFQWKELLLTPSIAIPVLPDHRFEWGAGLTIGWRFGLGGGKSGHYGET